jgi:type II secretory pathway component PulL
MLFGIKFLLGLLVMFLAALLAGKTSVAEKFRTNMGRWLNVAWFAALAIVVIAALLRTFH